MRTVRPALDEIHVLVDSGLFVTADFDGFQIGINQLDEAREVLSLVLKQMPSNTELWANRRRRTFPLKISSRVYSPYSSSTGTSASPGSGFGAGGKQFPSFFDFRLGIPLPLGSTGDDKPEEVGVERGDGTPGGKTSLRKKNFCLLTASRRCARAMLSSTYGV